MNALAGRIVLLTGSLGSQEHVILEVLARLGVPVLDADELAHRLTEKGTPAYRQIVGIVGGDCLRATAELDPFRLSQVARADPQVARALHLIRSGAVRDGLEAILREIPERLVVIRTQSPDAYGLRSLAVQIWRVSIDREERAANLVRNQGWQKEAAQRIAGWQPSSSGADEAHDLVLQTEAGNAELWDTLTSALRRLGVQVPEDAQPLNVASQPQDIAAVSPALNLTSAGAVPEPPPPTRPIIEDGSIQTQATEAPTVDEAEAPSHEAIAPPAEILAASSAMDLTNVPQTSDGGGQQSLSSVELRLVGRRILDSLLILLAIGFMTSWGLTLAESGRQGTPAHPLGAAWGALTSLLQYLTAHPLVYYVSGNAIPWLERVSAALGHSAGLLILSLLVALMLGLPLGIAAAKAQRRTASAVTIVISVLGASTPSFLIAMLLWLVNIWVHQVTGWHVLPSTGFGWDAHIVMPTLVLAMRPLAQIAQITYVTLRDALGEDYVRTAYAKGLGWRRVFTVHLLRNMLIPVLNTLGSSLRFSLSSLPVVELFFRWPGIGSTLLSAIDAGNASLVMDLTLSLGLFFLLVNLVLEFFFPLIDPRLNSTAAEEYRDKAPSAQQVLQQAGGLLRAWMADLSRAFRPTPGTRSRPSLTKLQRQARAARSAARGRVILRSIVRNPVFVLGAAMIASLAMVAIIGGRLEGTNAYQIHGVMAIDGSYAAPPFKPSAVFPWGTDNIGRDIQALLLAGAGRTLSLAFYGMLARLIVGTVLGILAGWQRGGWIDRLVTGAIGIWAAFPATVFAMIVIQALGIQQGMWVFVAAIGLVGWGEVAQFVRGQVIGLASRPFIEAARSVGARVDQILVREVVPNLVNPLVVLAALEMGGILMLLAELGFLNIFMGGGFKVMTGETGSAGPIITHYSDVPEWAALIANIRDQWRSHTWMALYPGLALFLSIMAFNLFGEGLRRFLEDAAISLSRMLNRRTLLVVAGLGAAMALIVGSSAPLNMYRAEGFKFEEARALEDVRLLASPELQGRETGTAGADLAALYIANRMAEIGLFPAGEHYTYFQRLVQPRMHLLALPTFSLLDGSGVALQDFTYRQDFREVSTLATSLGEATGSIMGVAYGPSLEAEDESQYGLGNSDAVDHVIIVREADLGKVSPRPVKAVLVVADDVASLLRRDAYPYERARADAPRPYLEISPGVADLLLRTAGSTLQELDAARSSLGPGQIHLTAQGSTVHVTVPAGLSPDSANEAYLNVMGVIPGQGHFVGMEDRVIVVSAYYDGVGTDPQGVLFPGANDNASGTAVMLELARLLKASAYQPDKTILFVAWAGGQRQEGLSTSDILNARPGANQLSVEAVIELSGVGAGAGNAISLGSDSSFRLVQLFQKAANRYGASTTTRGRGPHYGMPAPTYLGGREAMTLSLSWDGSDALAHTTQDAFSSIDPAKIRRVGESAYLTLLVLARETAY